MISLKREEVTALWLNDSLIFTFLRHSQKTYITSFEQVETTKLWASQFLKAEWTIQKQVIKKLKILWISCEQVLDESWKENKYFMKKCEQVRSKQTCNKQAMNK